MKILNEIELAELLYDTDIPPEDWKVICGEPKPLWNERDQGQQDDYLHQARAILKVARVSIGPGKSK
jgi:hypothetical protein